MGVANGYLISNMDLYRVRGLVCSRPFGDRGRKQISAGLDLVLLARLRARSKRPYLSSKAVSLVGTYVDELDLEYCH